MTRSAYDVKVQLSKLGQELELIHAKGAIDDIEQWIEVNSKVIGTTINFVQYGHCQIVIVQVLHPNHYHMVTAKHNLLQMYGRTEGYLIQVYHTY